MTDAEDRLVNSHLACADCGRIATRDEHREMMIVIPLAARPQVYRLWFGWEIDSRQSKEFVLCPECAK